MRIKSLLFGVCLSVLVLSGCSLIKTSQSNTPTNNNDQNEVSYEQINLGHDGRSTVPQTTTLSAGKNYKFVITPEQNGQGCMSTIKRAGTTADQSKLVVAGEPMEFSIMNAQPGEYRFVCNGMGMEQGKIVIQA